ncbi:MAG: hypothetical protein OEY29_15950 [Gammaproteobacteria bacterium]|nr:hypothetical protein [Gammaproteobacteria bacterium]
MKFIEKPTPRILWGSLIILLLVGLNIVSWSEPGSETSAEGKDDRAQTGATLVLNLPLSQAAPVKHRDIFSAQKRDVFASDPLKVNTSLNSATDMQNTANPSVQDAAIDPFQSWTQQATYVGYLKQGDSSQALMMNAGKPEVVKLGTLLQGQYRIVSLLPEQLGIKDIITGQQQILKINQVP